VTERRDDDGAKILKARVDSARHRFSDAQSVLDNLDRSNVASEDLRSTLRLALENDLEALRDQKRQIAEEFPSYRTLSTWASIEAALGDFEEADRLYVEALRTYNDVSPFPVAWVMFQRGVMWAESADRPERALPLYREAVRRLPSYVVAQVHLAELEAETGDVDDAISRLRSIAEETEDPEPAGLLGELLMDSDPIEAQRWIERARSIYDDLLKRHPEAFAHHGAEFFSGPGDDPERALELALANLGHRPVERAFLVAIEVAHSAGRSELACTLAEQAGPHGANLILRKRVRETMGHCEES
jgi:tetratricopeptide (TPR) repeat protein